MALGLGPITTGISAGAMLLLATLLVILAWRGKDRTAKWTFSFSGVSAILLALSQALLTLDIQVPVFRLLAVLAGLASILSLLAKLPGWLQVRAWPETVALVKEKEHVLGRLRESEAHLELLVEGVGIAGASGSSPRTSPSARRPNRPIFSIRNWSPSASLREASPTTSTTSWLP
jgi:hypothetical protein